MTFIRELDVWALAIGCVMGTVANAQMCLTVGVWTIRYRSRRGPLGGSSLDEGKGCFNVLNADYIPELKALSGAQTPTLAEREWQHPHHLFAAFSGNENLN